MGGRALPGLVLLLAAASRALADDAASRDYFPLRVGNWWAYEELDEQGKALSRETWTLIAGDTGNRAGEFHLHSFTKRLDALGRIGRRWEGDEYLRITADGVRKRYPAGHDAELEVLLLKEPARFGTRWRDAQGSCEVVTEGIPCVGPRGVLPDCLVVICRLGEPTATVVTSTYAREVGMVRQKVDVLQLLPSLVGGAGVAVPSDPSASGHSMLHLTAYHLGAP